jgi:oligoendopeptidase F
MRSKTLALFAAIGLVATGARAQTGPADAPANTPTAAAFQPIPPAEAAAYKFNFGNFYATPAAFESALKAMEAQVTDLQKLQGKVIASPQNLYRALKLSDDINTRFLKIYWYLDLQYSIRTANTAARNRATDLDAKYSPRLTFVNNEIQKITPDRFQKFVKAEPRLKTYSYVIDEALRGKPHTLGLKEEELLAKTGPLMSQWQEDMFDLLLDRAPWGTVKDPQTGRDLNVRQDAAELNNSPVREVRKEQYEKENTAYKDQRDLFASDFPSAACRISATSSCR